MTVLTNSSARLAFALVAAALLAAAPAAAQSIHGQLVEEESGAPIPGAFVLLFDETGAQKGAALSDAEGRFILVAPRPGAYVLGLDRIGYMSTRTEPIPLARDQVLAYRLSTVVRPVELADIDVTIESECVVRPAEGAAAARLWEEARKALNLTAFAQQMGLLRYSIVARERDLDPYSFRVRRERTRSRTGISRGGPYVALPASVLAREGFVRTEDREQTYYGPDAATLVSDEFLDTHCFRVREPPPAEPDLVGLAFEPVRDRRLPDIAGTLWIDAETAELERLDYLYTGLPAAIGDHEAGGRIGFDRLPSGEWYIDEWSIRMPVVRLPDERMYSHLTMDPGARTITLLRVKEDSGEVTRIVPARIAAKVEEVATARRVWSEPIPVERVLATAPVLGPPRARGARACPGGVPDPGAAVLTGFARDSVTGIALPGTRVEAAWDDLAGEGPEVVAGADGSFALCGVPAGREVRLLATFPGRSGEADVVVPEAGGVAMVDVALTGDDAVTAPEIASRVTVLRMPVPDGRAAVSGVVRDAVTGLPLTGAQVSVAGTAMGLVTDENGGFELTGVPPGYRTIEVAFLGYEAGRAGVRIAEEERIEMTARLVPSAIAVAALEVTFPVEERLERRGVGATGYVLTADDIPEHTSLTVADLVARRFAGVVVRRRDVYGCPVVETRGGRIDLVMLDGQPFRDTCVLDHVRPVDILTLEIRPGLGGTGAFGRSGAGVIVIETKHGDE